MLRGFAIGLISCICIWLRAAAGDAKLTFHTTPQGETAWEIDIPSDDAKAIFLAKSGNVDTWAAALADYVDRQMRTHGWCPQGWYFYTDEDPVVLHDLRLRVKGFCNSESRPTEPVQLPEKFN